jgi:hypothetical protein
MENKRYEFEVLNGPTYSEDSRPPFWHNTTQLIDVKDNSQPRIPITKVSDLPLKNFPLVQDFEVRLERFKVDGEVKFGVNVYFFSFSRGYMASFPWWDCAERDLIKETFQIPFGDFDQPFEDCEQGWEIIIFADDEFVYVLEGNFELPDAPIEERFYLWFKVDKSAYLGEWQKAIDLCRKTFSPPSQ